MYNATPTTDNGQLTAAALTLVLSNEYLLYAKTRNAHWHIKGHAISDKEPFFEKQFTELAIIIDTVTERIRKLGYYSEAMLNAHCNISNAVETKFDENDSQGYIKELITDHNSIVRNLKANTLTFSNSRVSSSTGKFIETLIKPHEALVLALTSRQETPRILYPTQNRALRFYSPAEKRLAHSF